MPYYFVYVKEVHEQAYAVEADNEIIAKMKVVSGEASLVEDDFCYSMTEDVATWRVKEDPEAAEYIDDDPED